MALKISCLLVLAIAASLLPNTFGAVPCGTGGATDCVANQGVCDTVTGICWCVAGFGGVGCAEACESGSACANGLCISSASGSCKVATACPVSACADTGTCTSFDDGASRDVKCQCDLGYSGETCATIECSNPCLNGGTCGTTTPNVCDCPAGLTGSVCETVDCSAGDPCLNDKPCGTSSCNCGTGLTGDICQTVDCAAGNPCQNSHPCDDSTTPDTCSCDATKYAGDICQQECTTACTVYEVCMPGASAATCDCRTGLTGTGCATISCANSQNPCLNGGTCDETSDTCACVSTTAAGDICQYTCDPVCSSDQTCKVDGDSATCSGAAMVTVSMFLALMVAMRQLV